jgi:RimJ/RimL family protein N-acetyltransferase
MMAMKILLETDRLTLRAATPKDVDNLYDLNSDPEVMRYINGGQATPRNEIINRIIPLWLDFYDRGHGLGYWIAQDRADHGFLGWFHFRPGDSEGVELGYRLQKAAWNQGYATEGSRALIRKGFTDMGVSRVFAHTLTVNAASRRVIEKCGLVLARTFRSEQLPDMPGAEKGEVEYALTRDQWLASPEWEGQR